MADQIKVEDCEHLCDVHVDKETDELYIQCIHCGEKKVFAKSTSEFFGQEPWEKL